MSEIVEHSGGLPEQIIMDEILVRLPVKSLCRFKSVSKLWYAVISSAQFAKSHLKKNSNFNSRKVFFQYEGDSRLLYYEAYDEIEDHKDPRGLFSLGKMVNDAQLNGFADADVFGSSCGLVCLSAQQGQIYLYNPILQQSQMIDAPEPFDVKEDILLRGFGYVSSIDDFKLVLGLKGHVGYPMLYVYSLKNNDWRLIESGDYHFDVLATSKVDSCNGILVNERLHWWTTPVGTNNNGRIFAFDLLHEMFDEVPIPETLSSKVSYMFNSLESSGLCTMEGCLCLSIIWEDHNVEIWMLKEYGDPDSWIRLYNLRFMSCYKYICSSFFGCTKNGKFLISCWNKSRYNFFFLVDPNHQYYPKFNHVGHFWGGTSTIVDYVESLVSLPGLVT